jgi:hypothetical protein
MSWFSSLFQRPSSTTDDEVAASDGAAPPNDSFVCSDDHTSVLFGGSDECTPVVDFLNDNSTDVADAWNADWPDNGVDCSEESSAPNEAITVGARFATSDALFSCVNKYSRSVGFRIATNPHFFTKANPHPVHGPDAKLWQRGVLYCTFKDPIAKKDKRGIKSTCTWSLCFTFDRSSVDYVVTRVCGDHNHVIEDSSVTPDGGLKEITLDADLESRERDMIHSLARYNLPLSKVGTFLEKRIGI